MGNSKSLFTRWRSIYVWVVLTSCFFILAALFGIRYSFGVLLSPLQIEFGCTRAATSALFSLYMLLTPVFAILGGWASHKYGPKLVALVIGIISGLSLLLTRQAESLG